MEREREYIKPRNPTAENDLQLDLQKKEMRKKLYRKRTREEVGKAVGQTADMGEDVRERLDGDGKEADESTVDMSVNTTKRAGGELAEYARTYSNKLSSERSENRERRSESLRDKKRSGRKS